MQGSAPRHPRSPAGRLPLRPTPATGGSCPRCHKPLRLTRHRYPGWRVLLDGECATCGHRYLQDAPAGHGLLYPTSLDLSAGELLADGQAAWFAQPLLEQWSAPDREPVALRVDRRRDATRAVLLNCLDPIYGHALLRLLNAGRELEPGTPVIVVVPKALEVLVPAEVSEAWVVDEPLARLGGWLVDFEGQVLRELERFDACELSPAFPHPAPDTWDLSKFARRERRRYGEPSIALSFRVDRLWGRTLADQESRVAELCDRLRAAYPAAGVVLLGPERYGRAPAGTVDLRSRGEAEAEREWIAASAGADLVIGVHGSNMLLPSGLAATSIELLPSDRYGNAGQATLARAEPTLRALLRHRTIYGSSTLDEIAPERVAELAISVLADSSRLDERVVGPLAGSPVEPPPSGLPGFPRRGREAATATSARPLAPKRLARGLRRLRAAAADGQAKTPRGPWPAAVRSRDGDSYWCETAEEAEGVTSRPVGEREEFEVLRTLVPSGGVVVDVGANIGLFAIPISRRLGALGRVYAFEPLSRARERLERNLALNGISNVEVVPLALSDRSSTRELADYGAGRESWASLAPRSIETATGTLQPVAFDEVETSTLDGFCGARGVAHVDVAKIDVEGGELDVLNGARSLLRRAAIDVLLVELSDNTLGNAGATSFGLVELLEELGYGTYVLSPERRIVSYRPVGHVDYVNVFAAPDGRTRWK